MTETACAKHLITRVYSDGDDAQRLPRNAEALRVAHPLLPQGEGSLVVEAHKEAEDLLLVARLRIDREGEVQGDRRGAHHGDRDPQSEAGAHADLLVPFADRRLDRAGVDEDHAAEHVVGRNGKHVLVRCRATENRRRRPCRRSGRGASRRGRRSRGSRKNRPRKTARRSACRRR